MDSKAFIATGLQPLQAQAYALLLESGGITPPQAAKQLGLTRTNAYKLFDKLVELGLARKVERAKKFTYEPGNPLALSRIVNEERNRVVAQENAVKQIMSQMLAKYYESNEQPHVEVVTGRDQVADAYRQQINLQESVYFIRSQADIAAMGFQTMHDIRVAPAHYGQQRYGITPDVLHGPVNPEGDVRSNLTRTWARQDDYSSPVEWSISGSSLLIVLFGEEPHAITITNPVIAQAFLQIWTLLEGCLRAMPYYNELPRTT